MITTDETTTIDSYLPTRVRNFKKNGPYAWRWSCTICGDSKTDIRKARFYVGESDNTLKTYCFNCGWSGTLLTYLKLEHRDLYESIQHKKFVQSENILFNHDELVETLPDNVLVDVFFIRYSRIANEWIAKLKSKKIFVTRKNFQKLLLLHQRFHQPAH